MRLAALSLVFAIATLVQPARAGDPPLLTLMDGFARESARDLVVAARLSRPAKRPVLAIVRISGGDAQRGVDYLPPAPQLVMLPGETEARITITVQDDRKPEPDERIYVALDRVEGAEVARGRAVAVIQDDEPKPARVQQAALGHAPRAATPTRRPTARLGPLSTAGGRIVDASGVPYRLHGVNWFGLETPNFAPHGIWKRDWRGMMNQMRELGFNVIRLPFSNALLRDAGAPNGIDFHKNSDFQGLSGLEIMDKIIAYAGAIGMRVILDNHRITAGHGAESSGLWHSPTFSEDQWVADWRRVAQRYRNMPAVVGADLFNEPHGPARWGGGGPNDWRRAAMRAGEAVLAESPNWLIIVEGVAQAAGTHYWDGGNLAGARQAPIRLSRPDKLVYSTHVYPASVYEQPWLQGRDFAKRLPDVWRRHWAFLFEQNAAPVLIGEFGSHLQTARDKAWMRTLTAFLARPAAEGRIAWTYWSWNPNSGDTGGILKDDWNDVHQAKLDAIRPLLPGGPTHGRGRRLAAIDRNADAPG